MRDGHAAGDDGSGCGGVEAAGGGTTRHAPGSRADAFAEGGE